MSKWKADDTLRRLNRSLAAYVEGETGLPYHVLLKFAEPLFSLYNLDLRSAKEPANARETEELATLLAVLDTARLLWAYFLLEPDEARVRLRDLRRALVGPAPSREEDQALIDLFRILNARWNEFRLSAEHTGGATGYVLPSFDQLLSGWSSEEVERVSGDDVDLADLPESLAAFARPIFERTDLEDPDAVEDALARAQAYWELAQHEGEAFERGLEGLVDRFAGGSRSIAEVRREAQHMKERYKRLFGDQATGA